MSDRFYQNARPINEGLTPQTPKRYVEGAWLTEDEPPVDVPADPDIKAKAAVALAARRAALVKGKR